MLHHYRNLSNVTTITPTAVLELRGAFKNHPKQARERAGEPRPTEPLGDPPKRLKPVDKAAWREMQEHGALRCCRFLILPKAACLLGEWGLQSGAMTLAPLRDRNSVESFVVRSCDEPYNAFADHQITRLA